MQIRAALFRPLRLLYLGLGSAWASLRKETLELRMHRLDERRVQLKNLRVNALGDPLTEQMLDGVAENLDAQYKAAVAACRAATRQCERWRVRLFLARHGF
jgi:hypothetical protein